MNWAREKSAVLAICAACVFSAVSGLAFYWARSNDPLFSSESAILVRIFSNLACFLPMMIFRKSKDFEWPKRSEKPLWLWGFFGVLTVWSYFLSIAYVGVGAANLLNAGSGVLIVGLAPFFLGQPFVPLHLFCAFGSFLGLGIFTSSSSGPLSSSVGLALGLASGIFNALAYLMVSKARQGKALRAIFYWSWLNIVVGFVIMMSVSLHWPRSSLIWLILIGTGCAAAAAQYLTAYAYQASSASLVACLSFIGPFITLMVDAWMFDVAYSATAVCGIAMVLLFALVPSLLGVWSSLRVPIKI